MAEPGVAACVPAPCVAPFSCALLVRLGPGRLPAFFADFFAPDPRALALVAPVTGELPREPPLLGRFFVRRLPALRSGAGGGWVCGCPVATAYTLFTQRQSDCAALDTFPMD